MGMMVTEARVVLVPAVKYVMPQASALTVRHIVLLMCNVVVIMVAEVLAAFVLLDKHVTLQTNV